MNTFLLIGIIRYVCLKSFKKIASVKNVGEFFIFINHFSDDISQWKVNFHIGKDIIVILFLRRSYQTTHGS